MRYISKTHRFLECVRRLNDHCRTQDTVCAQHMGDVKGQRHTVIAGSPKISAPTSPQCVLPFLLLLLIMMVFLLGATSSCDRGGSKFMLDIRLPIDSSHPAYSEYSTLITSDDFFVTVLSAHSGYADYYDIRREIWEPFISDGFLCNRSSYVLPQGSSVQNRLGRLRQLIEAEMLTNAALLEWRQGESADASWAASMIRTSALMIQSNRPVELLKNRMERTNISPEKEFLSDILSNEAIVEAQLHTTNGPEHD